MPFVVLQSSDNEKFNVDVELAKDFGTIKNMLDCCGMQSEHQGVIPLVNVDSETLSKILEWTEHFKDKPKPIVVGYGEERQTTILTEWDKEFLNVPKEMVFKLLIAANYLDIPSLMQVTSKQIANMMQGKTPQEIRDIFNIENDFTCEEESEIWNENEWLSKN